MNTKLLRFTISKTIFSSTVVLFFFCCSLQGQTVFWSEDFETDGTSTRYTADHQFIDEPAGAGGTEDFFGRCQNVGGALQYVGCVTAPIDITNPFTGQSGDFFMAGEDIDDALSSGGCGDFNTGTSVRNVSFLASQGHDININGASDMTFKFLVAVGTETTCNTTESRWDAGDGLEVYYTKDGGTEIQAYSFQVNSECGDTTNEPLWSDPNNDGNTTDGVVITAAFQEFSFTIPAGGTSLEIRIEIDADASDEEIALDYLRLEAVTVPVSLTVCPTVATASVSEAVICANTPFDVTATNLANMDGASNMDQDFGIEFIAFTSTPTDPYTGGVSLGEISFGDLTAASSTANLQGVTLTNGGVYEIYAILSPAPTEVDCRPSAMTSITIDAIPELFITNIVNECIDVNSILYTSTSSPSGGVHTGPGITDMGGGVFEFNSVAAGAGTHTLTYTYTTENNCSYSVTDEFEVYPLPTVTFTALDDLDVDAGLQLNIGGVISNPPAALGALYFYGDGLIDNANNTYSFDPAVAGVGVHTLTVFYNSVHGCSVTVTDEVEVLMPTSIGNIRPQDQPILSIAPNPFSDHTEVRLSKAFKQNTPITVFDALGRSVFSSHIEKGRESERFDFSTFESGVYTLVVGEGHQVIIKRITKL